MSRPAAASTARNSPASSIGRSSASTPSTPAAAAAAREGLEAHPQDRVGVAEDDDRRRDRRRARRSIERERRAQAAAGRQRPLGRALDHRAVGQRIRERHADLEDVGAGAIERLQDLGRARQVGIAGGHVGDEPGCCSPARSRAKRSSIRDRRVSRASARPGRKLLLHRVHVLVAAARQVDEHDRRRGRARGPAPAAWAIACADSSAGRMPSSRASVWNAVERLVVARRRRTRCARSTRSQACSGPTAA